MNVRIGRAAAGGLIGTVIMTVVGLWVGPLVGIPKMNPAQMLAGAMGGQIALGWMAHFMIGVALAVIYARVADRLPGAPALRGALFGVAPFFVAQILVMPLMGMPLFSGSVQMAIGSLIGHVVYGAAVGQVYGLGEVGRAPAGATV